MRRRCNESATGTGIAGFCTSPIAHSMSDDRHPVRRASVAQWTTYLLFACLALEAGTIASRLSERALIAPAVADAQPLPDDVAASDARWRADAEKRADARSRAIGTLNLVALACTAVLWLVWLHRAYTNLVFVGSKRVRFSPTWAVGYWFIPFVNLVRAYQVMKDLWLRSESRNDRDGYDDLPAPVLLRGWWGMSLAWAGLEPVFTSLARDARTAEQLSDATHLGIAVGAVGIVATVLAIRVVREIDRRQRLFD
ncbi:MAG: hypothetical protein DMD45_16655 [Gemmatimonadetes bacterium]|nr:MAG: hypothetical protein DMD45_16655 [Gemmatimonadota bacterium]